MSTATVTPLSDEEWREAQDDLAFVTAVILRLPLDRFILRALNALEALDADKPAPGTETQPTWAKVHAGLRTVIRTAAAALTCQRELRAMYDEAMRERGDDRRAPDPNTL